MQNLVKVNTVLFTKDGRLMGNAIVTNIYTKEDAVTLEDGLMFEITTDYGNKCNLNEHEIEELFYVANDRETTGQRHKHFVKQPILYTRLITKDSEKISNSTVTEVATDNFRVKTDGGGECALNAAAINNLFDYDVDQSAAN